MNVTDTELPDDPAEREEMRNAINNRLAEIEHIQEPQIEAQKKLAQLEKQVLASILAEMEEDADV